MKQIALSFRHYLQDTNGSYPPIKIHDDRINYQRAFGWADATQSYLKDQSVFWCPILKEARSRNFRDRKPNSYEYTDYWFNRRIAGANESKINSVQSTILLGDGNDGTDATNARYSLSTLPAAWRTDKSSPAHRHLEGANYAFVDGHVKWIKPNKVTDKKPGDDVYTFAIK
jgi:prepilin-type processing-associated H-X9-DG protein